MPPVSIPSRNTIPYLLNSGPLSAGQRLIKNSPERTKRLFSCSKKAFKLSIGRRYKERKIAIEESGIRLLSK
ncbi:hypothetical protein [Amphritea sp.]|uniref:hypothetical protein n=1 Tax=Amphritea sp. TaxID=1872502 RepID=UPI0025C09224|nr:hypothetical protein [Amphritea sp.]